MGKAKPRHKSSRTHSKSQGPLTGDSGSEESELNITSTKDFLIQNIMDEIQSSNVEERICGLRSLADMAESPESAETIIKYKMLKIIAPFLVDKNSEVRNLTAGILRNLSATGSIEVCEILVKEDIMTPLVALLQQYNDWKPEPNTEDTDTFLQVVNILWNVCETNETALSYFNSANLLNVLLRCLDYKTVGVDLSITVCQCLNSVSEENPAVISVLRSHESDLLSLLSITAEDNKLLLLKTLAAGILVNLNASVPWLALVLSVVSEALGTNIRVLVNKLSSNLPLDSSTPTDPDTLKLIEDAEMLTQAQTMAFEILANLTSTQDDEMDVESEGSASEDEAEETGWGESDKTQPLALSPEIHEGMEKYKLVSLMLTKLDPLPVNVTHIINNCSSSQRLAKRVVRLQCRAFLCFNNLVSVCDLEQLGGPKHLSLLVKYIPYQNLHPDLSYTDPDNELLEAITASIRAVVVRLASMKFTELADITSRDLEMIFNIGLSPDHRVQANVIRIVGALGMVLNVNHVLVKMAGKYLLQSAEKQSTLWLTAEAMDSLLDLFAEDYTDSIARDINLVPRLHALVPRFKSKMRQERKTLGEHYPLVSTVMKNLTPFIKYKGARIASMVT